MSEGDFQNELIDTGFDLVTATVTEPEGLTPEGISAMQAMVAIPAAKSMPHVLVALARDIAINIRPLSDLLREHGLNNAQYEYLSQYNEFFKKALAQQANEWQGIGSTQDRLKAQAAAGLEANLPSIASRMGTRTEKLGDVVEAAKLFAKVAGVDTSTGGSRPGGEGFTISIDLGADERLTVRSGPGPDAGLKTIEPSGAGQDPQR